jgi:hypothetical protein
MKFCNTDDTADSGSSSDRLVSQPDELHQPTNHSNVPQLLGYLLGGHLVFMLFLFLIRKQFVRAVWTVIGACGIL